MAAGPAATLPALRQRIASYYGSKILRHGATPQGVDWTCAPTQQLRFVQLLRLCDFSAPFSLNDMGCGYGALLELIAQRHARARMDYLGIDLAPEMVDAARRRWARKRGVAFHAGSAFPRTADYTVASGIFNVRIDEPLALWEEFIATTLREMAAHSTRGFAVNFLRELPAGMEGKPQLYRTQPGQWAGFCEREVPGGVEVLDHYGMREFTLLVRK